MAGRTPIHAVVVARRTNDLARCGSVRNAGGRVDGPAAGLAEDALDLRGALLIAFGDTAVNFERATRATPRPRCRGVASPRRSWVGRRCGPTCRSFDRCR